MNRLPTFKGYTVDVRLKEFRKVVYGQSIAFIPFDSELGDQLLGKLIQSLPTNSALFEDIRESF